MDRSSYGRILKTSSIIGGVSALTLILGMLRTKSAALLIGAAGIGVISSMLAIQGLMGALIGLGIQSSGVHGITSALLGKNLTVIAQTILSLRRISFITGFCGLLIMYCLSKSLSLLTFGSDKYEWDIAFLGVAILLTNIQGAELALIQGMRRMGDLAKVQIIGTLFGTAGSIAFYYFLGLRGVVPAIVFIATAQLLTSLVVVSQIELPQIKIKMKWIDSFILARGMFGLGFSMMWTGLLGAGIIYAINAFISREISLEAVGIYSAAFSLSGVFVNFILNAMGADYYPRLVEASNENNEVVNRLINEQTEIGLLMSGPGLMATIVMSPLAIHIFYSGEFSQATSLLQWFVLGCFGRVIAWPMSYVLLAFKKSTYFFLLETTAHLFHMGLVFLGFYFWGLEGVAIGFFILYILYICMTYKIAKSLTDFSWNDSTKRLMVIVSLILVMVFLVTKFCSLELGVGAGLLLTILGIIISMCGLSKRLGDEHKLIKIWYQIPGSRALRKIYFINY